MMSSTKYREYKNKKWERPFSSSLPLHLTLRSDVAKGEYFLLKRGRRSWISAYIFYLCKKFHITLFHHAVAGNHLHLGILTHDKNNLNNLLRALSGNIARKVLGAEKGKKKEVKFWSERPGSRVLTWGQEFQRVLRYIERNILEAKGKIRYLTRDQRVPETLVQCLRNRIQARRGQLALQI